MPLVDIVGKDFSVEVVPVVMVMVREDSLAADLEREVDLDMERS